ncbi:MAG TPA: PqqD family protein [Gemmatimonadaceae bacterium]|nr:PqqD family protein [Gemmatimonadaceae bacterium]
MEAPSLTLGTRLVVTKDQVSANVAGESVILGMRDGVYYGLDPVATRIWELLHTPTTLETVLGAITAEFDVSREQATNDLLAFANDLLAHGLVDRVGG